MSTYADEGTVAHALAAMALTEGRPAGAYINRVITCDDYPHAKKSPSTAHRWMVCAGSHALETRIEFKPRKFSMTVTHDMADGVQVYLDNIAKYRVEGSELMVEQQLPIGHLTGEEGATGTGDAVILEFVNAEIQVHDLKFGRGVEVSAEDNPQLAMYLLGALEQYAMFAPEGGWKSFRGVIHQPRISASPSEYRWTLEQLQAFAEKAKAAAHLAEEVRRAAAELPEGIPGDSIHLVPGEKQCQFCDAKAKCPAIARLVAETVIDGFRSLDDLPPAKPGALVAIPADNARLAQLLQFVPLIESWCSHIAAHAEAELLAGRPVPGFKLVQGRKGSRAWTDKDAAEAALKGFRLKQEEMYSFNLISPTQAEKVLKESPRRWTKLLPLVTQSEGKPSVVPESDKRPALQVQPVAEAFANLEQQEELV